MNKVILCGNITRDIELKNTASSSVAQIGLAMNRKWTTPEGEKREEVCFIDCEAWGKTAENIAKFFSKGKKILIEGRLKLDQWEDKESGQKRSKVKVVIESFHFVDSKGEGAAPTPAQAPASKPSTGWSKRTATAAAPSAPMMADEDIPFSPEPGYRI